MTIGFASLVLIVGVSAPMFAASPESQSRLTALKIVVVDGEGAVNIIQQKTAVAPLVEVRDQNGLPVAGAVVKFTITGARHAAFAGGSPTFTVTADAAGRAAASGFSPLGSGSVQIQVQAAFQGQTAAATIAQTNVMTAAEASSAASSAAGAPAAGGGGINGLAIAGIVGGVAAAGAVVATQMTNDAAPDSAAAPDPAIAAAAGNYLLQQIDGAGLPAVSVGSPPNSCPVVTDSSTMELKASPQEYTISEHSHNDCRIGSTGETFNASYQGTWSIQGSTITFIQRGGIDLNFGPATLSGSLLSAGYVPPHVETGKTNPRVNSTWRK
jgi:hypothetical protein